MTRAHLIAGGYPIGSPAGHDMDYARLRLLEKLYQAGFRSTVAEDFGRLDDHLDGAALLVTYTAGPIPSGDQNQALARWLRAGGKWLALHGSSGGRAARIAGSRQRRMLRGPHHDTLGALFLNHPPLRRFEVTVHPGHQVTDGVASFRTVDELYLIEPIGEHRVLLSTELPTDPSPPGFGFVYDRDTSLRADGKTRILGLEHRLGDGGVVYLSLGHCHDPVSNMQPSVDDSLGADGSVPNPFRGSWETTGFNLLLDNALTWAA